MRILNTSQNTILASQARAADSFWSRLTGLLGRKGLASDEALVISDCRCIHMFFMKFPIDVIFVSRKGSVLRLARGIKPFCVSPYVWGAYYAVEGAVGMIDHSGTRVGDLLEFKTELLADSC